MPRHKQVATCRRNGGPVSKFCTCEHCTLSVCAVCGAYEGSLTTDCPGTKVAFTKQQEVCETLLDYTDERGWHLRTLAVPRSPLFERLPVPPEETPVDPRQQVTTSIDWTAVDRYTALQHELSQRAIAWVLADRACDDQAAALPIENEPADPEGKRIRFRNADQRAQQCDEEFRQAAHRLVTALEASEDRR